MKPLTWILAAVCFADRRGLQRGLEAESARRLRHFRRIRLDRLRGTLGGFSDVMLGPANDDMDMPYELYTVSSSQSAVTSSGGARVVPQYTLDDAPRPDLIVIGANRTTEPSCSPGLDRSTPRG